MAANFCPISTKLSLDNSTQIMCTISNILDSTFDGESLDQFLKKNDTEWMMMRSKDLLSTEDDLPSKMSSEWSSTFSTTWDKAKPLTTQSFSDLKGKCEMENPCKEQFELFNVSMPDLISGHVCQDVCICFCNNKVKQANKLRHVILMCASHERDADNSSSAISPSSSSLQKVSVLSSSLSLSLSGQSLENSYSRPSIPKHLSINHELSSQKCFRSWKFSDDCAIYEIHYGKGHRHRYRSCPLEACHLVSLLDASEVVSVFDMKVMNMISSGDLNLGWEGMISFKRIQNELSVIQLKQNIVKKDYSRRKWAKLEERKIIQNIGRIDDKTRSKRLQEIDYELLEMGDKYRKDSQTIQKLFNAELDKLSKLYIKYEALLSLLLYQNSSGMSTDNVNSILTSNDFQTWESVKKEDCKERGKNCLKYDARLKLFKCLDSNLMAKEVSKDESQPLMEGSDRNNEEGDDNLHQESRSKTMENVSGAHSFIEEQSLLNIANTIENVPKIQFRKTHQCKNRPLTRYLPVKGEADFNLRLFIEQAGHCLDLCQDVKISSCCARGFLKKIGRRLRTWRRRWFVFDRDERQLRYYSDRSEVVLKGKISFQAIEDVYIDASMLQCSNSKAVFCLKTLQRTHVLAAPSNQARQIWMDALFTGAEAYQEYLL